MMRAWIGGRLARAAATAAVALAAVATLAGPASAHEERVVGDYLFEVGFGDEPAFSGQKNSVQLIVSRATEGGEPGDPVVRGVDLQVEVGFGDRTMTLALEPDFVPGVFGEPGDYRAFFIPNRPGTYSFRFTGTVEGQPVDETFTSGPETFDDVQDASRVAFPADDPTTAELARRLQREGARTEEALASVERRAGRAATAGTVGIGLGAAALVAAVALGAVALARRPRGA